MMPKGPSSRTLVVLFRVLAFATLLLSQTSWALPEFVRYGYNNCTACHYSPSGGGVLNPYGREFSANTLSMIDGGGPFLFGAVNLPSWLAMQGELSTLNLRDNDPATNTTTPTNIFMQEDLEAAEDRTPLLPPTANFSADGFTWITSPRIRFQFVPVSS
jgi:hypothetical protein